MARITKEEFQRIFPTFPETSDPLLDDLLASVVYKEVPRKTPLYHCDACPGIGFVLAGEIRVFKSALEGKEVTLFEIYPGETCILNASCILSGSKYPADAIALTDLALLFLPAGVFLRLVARHEEMRAYVFSFLNQRLGEIIELLEEVTFGRLDARLSDYLIQKAEDGVLKTTHQNIANDLGTTREVVSRLLKDFERRGQVALSRNRIELVAL
jgi:CRP/FNR family transcriptional regulator